MTTVKNAPPVAVVGVQATGVVRTQPVATEEDKAPWGESIRNARPMVFDDVLKVVPFRKSWIYAAIKDDRFPAGRKIGRRRFWYEEEVAEAMKRLIAA